LRSQVRQQLRVLGVAQERGEAVILVMDEIVTNSIEHSHGYRNSNGCLTLRLRSSGNDLQLDFEDPDVPGPIVRQLASTLVSWRGSRPPVDSERGRGLYLIARNVDRLEIDERPGGGMWLRAGFSGAVG
jgi:anti-sigma regulatory factor (Ser/Thr protein kinase)